MRAPGGHASATASVRRVSSIGHLLIFSPSGSQCIQTICRLQEVWCLVAFVWEFLSHFFLVLTAAAEPERASRPHGREGRLLPGRRYRLAPQQPAGLRRGGSPQLPHALHAAHLPVPHGEERQRWK